MFRYYDDEIENKFYNYKGIYVTALHGVYEDGKLVDIKDSKLKKELIDEESHIENSKFVYCLVTKDKKTISPETGEIIEFADLEHAIQEGGKCFHADTILNKMDGGKVSFKDLKLMIYYMMVQL